MQCKFSDLYTQQTHTQLYPTHPNIENIKDNLGEHGILIQEWDMGLRPLIISPSEKETAQCKCDGPSRLCLPLIDFRIRAHAERGRATPLKPQLNLLLEL